MLAKAERGAVPEQGPTEPKISVTIAFSSHETPNDARWIAPLLEKTDIFIPELPGWSEGHLKIYRRISSGLLTPEQYAADAIGLTPFSLEQLRVLFGSRKPVLFIDVPKDHPIHQGIEERFKKGSLVQLLKPDAQFEEFLPAFVRASVTLGLTVGRYREEYLCSQLKPAVIKLWKEHPRLRRQSEIRVLLQLGISHTPISAYLRRDGVMAVSRFDKLPAVRSYSEEIYRRAISDREIDKELLARRFLDIYCPEGFGITTDYLKAPIITRMVLSQFSFEDAREIFEGMKLGQSFGDLFADKLKEKGIVLPKTELELDTLLESRGIKFRKFRPSP